VEEYVGGLDDLQQQEMEEAAAAERKRRAELKDDGVTAAKLDSEIAHVAPAVYGSNTRNQTHKSPFLDLVDMFANESRPLTKAERPRRSKQTAGSAASKTPDDKAATKKVV
jgi:hypothetical protein